MTGPRTPSMGSALLGLWLRWWRLVEWGWSAAAMLSGRGDCRARLTPATRDRLIDLIEGDLDLLVEDAKEKPVPEQSVEEMLRNREVLNWLRGGSVPGRGAVELLEDNVAVFYRESAGVEQANGDAYRAALNELLRAQSAADALPSSEVESEATVELTESERGRFGRNLDEMREWRNLTVGELSARSGVGVVTVVALIHGAQEAGSVDLMKLASALEVPPRDLFPECATGYDDESPGGDV